MRVSLEEYLDIFKSDPVKDLRNGRIITMNDTNWFVENITIRNGIFEYADLTKVEIRGKRIRRKKKEKKNVH